MPLAKTNYVYVISDDLGPIAVCEHAVARDALVKELKEENPDRRLMLDHVMYYVTTWPASDVDTKRTRFSV